MIKIKFPDSNVKEFKVDSTGAEIAESISSSLAKKAIAMKLNGKMVDLDTKIKTDSSIEIITTDSDEALEIIRHDTAHLLAQAVKNLYPETLVTIGPVIENGFFYDFDRDTPFSIEDLSKIEAEMTKIASQGERIIRKVLSKEEALRYFEDLGEKYKLEIINEFPANEEISIYTQGDFADLCRGPHSPSTKNLKAFKLMKVAGAYWRGDSNNKMLQRIYGTAWRSKAELDDYLTQLEEAEKRDHRKLGKEMDLFHFQEEAPGAVFWHPKGWRLVQNLIQYMRKKQYEAGYEEISTPEIMSASLWHASGHMEKYGENMFKAQAADEERDYVVRPMNCPGGVQVFKSKLSSYRDLPMRLSEFGKVHRYETSGSLHGLMRVRAFTQDDAHIFCTEDQIIDECQKMTNLILQIYKDFGFENVKLYFSDRPEKRVGSDEVWDKAEGALLDTIKKSGLEYQINSGDGAFYGPKIDFVLRDAIGRYWQLGTIQVDLNLPVRLDARYIGADGNKHYPVMLHRAMFGSIERFTGILLEHYAGHLPLWLSPVHAVVASITNEQDEYSRYVYDELRKIGAKVELDLESDKIGYKIRRHSLAKIPIIVTIGKIEAATNKVSIRKLGSQEQESMDLKDFITLLQDQIKILGV